MLANNTADYIWMVSSLEHRPVTIPATHDPDNAYLDGQARYMRCTSNMCKKAYQPSSPRQNHRLINIASKRENHKGRRILSTQ